MNDFMKEISDLKFITPADLPGNVNPDTLKALRNFPNDYFLSLEHFVNFTRGTLELELNSI